MSATSPRIDPSARVHPTAEIEDGVSIGANTAVWHRAQVRTGARIGRDGVIGRDVFVDEGVTIGDRVKIQNRALVYHGVTLADGVFIGPAAILTNDRRPRAENVAGDLAASSDWLTSPITVGRGASVGAGAIVVAGCDIGAYAMVGAGSVVTSDVSGHALAVGNPARRIGWVCACGARLLDADGRPAPATWASSQAIDDFSCAVCERRYGYLPEGGTLVERQGPRIPTGAGR
jgi:UDP-2-acetamido-3-amino-2,3-dideoxy-glucuronate N-acetyltransferase